MLNRRLIIACVVISSLNLSSRPAGASYGPTERLITYGNDTGRWTDRTGILTSRLAPKTQSEIPEPEIPDTIAWILISLGSLLFLIGAYVNWRSLRAIRRANRL